MESPDSKLKSSRTEAAEVGAEESEEVALPAAGVADGAEMREQPSRESSAVRGSGRKQRDQQEAQSQGHGNTQLCIDSMCKSRKIRTKSTKCKCENAPSW